MHDKIHNLDDAAAIRMLNTIAKHHFGADETQSALAPNLAAALQNETGLTAADGRVSDGDIARQALMALADDPHLQPVIADMVANPQPHRFIEPVSTILLTAGVVVALQTRFKVKRDEDGKLSWEIGKEATDNEIVKEFVGKFLSWVPSGPFK